MGLIERILDQLEVKMSDTMQNYWINTSVEDESIVTPVEPTNPSRLVFLQPIFSEKGRANTLIEQKSTADFYKEYGRSATNVLKYGQAGLNVIQAIQGGGSVFTCRLLPDDAQTSEMVVAVGIENNPSITQYERAGEDGKFNLNANKEKIAKTTTNLTGATENVTAAGVNLKIIAYRSDDGETRGSKDEDVWTQNSTWKIYPIFKVKSLYKGKCGKDLGLKFDVDSDNDGKATDGRRYTLSIKQRNQYGDIEDVLLEKMIYFSMNPDAELYKGSQVYESLSVTFKGARGDKPVSLEVFETNYDKIIDVLKPHSDTSKEHDIDFLFGKNKKGYDYNKILVSEDTDHINLKSTTKFLLGGHDGSLEVGQTVGGKTVTEESKKTTEESLLVDFYSFKTDKRLIDERIVDCTVALDANYPVEVKKTMLSTLRKTRQDIVVFVDCGITTRQDKAVSFANSLESSIDSKKGYTAIIVPQCGNTRNISRSSRVTATYEIARGLPETYNRFNAFSVYAGYRKGNIRYMDFDWIPRKSINNLEFSELKDKNLFYATQVDKNGRLAWMNEATQYGERYSKLRSIRNGLIIAATIKEASKILIKYVYDDSGMDQVVETASGEITTRLSNLLPSTIGITVNIFQTERDKQTENASCEIIFEFPNVPESFSVTIRARRLGDSQ